MVFRPNNFAKKPIKENQPPSRLTLSSKLAARLGRGSAAAHGHRRTRSNGSSAMIRTPKYAAQQAKRRDDYKLKRSKFLRIPVPALPVMADVEVATGTAPNAKTVHLALPRELPRPEYKEINQEILEYVDASFADTELEYVRDNVLFLAPQLVESLTSVRINSSKDQIPKELTIIANDKTAVTPSHIMAIWTKRPDNASASRPQKVTLYPVHSLVLAMYCSNLPKPPPTLPLPVHQSGEQEVKVPVWTLCLPSSETYPQLALYLYTKNSNGLMRNIFPSAPPDHFFENQGQLSSFATHLAQTFTVQALARNIFKVHGLWQNACALGIYDGQLWETMDLMWATMLTALAIATNNTSLLASLRQESPPAEDPVPQASTSSSA
ncbi:hypothetical protein CPB84DRAFT_1743692 [Gymnopilus junonius]|uniref:Uncharacterized protein n=1 Tax=Gymnopilus junonius TaxID=109634 RepID=A0A9P5NZA5_GYMJU|nr:hypothetical protein CPB84DRAFT_1743692 [Gymnopilus junonius]